jgi:threonine dehydrogenase-like Zn-dependent dehydrogenase
LVFWPRWYLKAYGYGNIQIAETNALRREMLEKIGVMRAYDPLCETPDSSRVDIIIDAVGSGTTRCAASALVRPGWGYCSYWIAGQ